MRPKNEPHLMFLYAKHCAVGFVLSAVFVGLLLGFDVVGLGSLIARSDVGILAAFLLWFFNGTVFGSVQFAIHVMNMQEPDEDKGPRGGAALRLAPQSAKAGTKKL